MIYFIRSPDGPIKIGTTIRLSRRLQALATEHGGGLEVLAVIEGDHGDESRLHRRFSHLRMVGEWFEPGSDLLGFIVSDGMPWDGMDEAPDSGRKQIASFRGKPEFEDWFEGLKKHSRLAGATLIEHALIEYAERHGYEQTPPER